MLQRETRLNTKNLGFMEAPDTTFKKEVCGTILMKCIRFYIYTYIYIIISLCRFCSQVRFSFQITLTLRNNLLFKWFKNSGLENKTQTVMFQINISYYCKIFSLVYVSLLAFFSSSNQKDQLSD